MRRNLYHLLKTGGLAVSGLLFLLGMPTGAVAHENVVLRGYDNQAIDPATSNEPYSPKNTCGSCHGYDTITSAYHFQQGFDVVADNYNPDKPWVKSPGMYGKW